METKIIITIKAILAVLLIVCLLKMPSWYYQFIRIAVCYGMYYIFGFEKEQKRYVMAGICFVIAVLFNPIFKIYFDKSLWQTIDVIIASFLIIWIINDVVYIYKVSKLDSDEDLE